MIFSSDLAVVMTSDEQVYSRTPVTSLLDVLTCALEPGATCKEAPCVICHAIEIIINPQIDGLPLEHSQHKCG